MNNLKMESIIARFVQDDKLVRIKPCGMGLINDTCFVECEKAKYILQRINTNVFKDPHTVMSNIIAVTSHLRSKGEATVRYLPSDDGRYYCENEDGFWRMSIMVEGETYNEVNADLLYEGAMTFGRFQRCLSDFDASALTETIPDFHNTKKRYKKLRETVLTNPCGRLDSCRELADGILSLESDASAIVDMLACGEIPLRVVHNDTKINNVIFDDEGKGVCVIDLDTVMPGSVLYDFGDAIRSGAANVPEGSDDFEHTFLRTDYYKAFLKGFLEGTDGNLTDREIECLPLSAYILSLELAVRFIDDYICGDTYFKVSYPSEGFIRAKGQYLLALDIKNRIPELSDIACDILKKQKGGN